MSKQRRNFKILTVTLHNSSIYDQNLSANGLLIDPESAAGLIVIGWSICFKKATVCEDA